MRGREAGFTVVELMIAVAIVAVLAAVGIPLFVEAQAKAKCAEVRPNLEAILSANIAYVQGTGSADPIAYAWPLGSSGTPTKQAKPAEYTSFVPADAWAALGFAFEGDIRARYAISSTSSNAVCNILSGVGSGAGGRQLHVSGRSDADGDGKIAESITCENGPGTGYPYQRTGRTGQRAPGATYGAF